MRPAPSNPIEAEGCSLEPSRRVQSCERVRTCVLAASPATEIRGGCGLVWFGISDGAGAGNWMRGPLVKPEILRGSCAPVVQGRSEIKPKPKSEFLEALRDDVG